MLSTYKSVSSMISCCSSCRYRRRQWQQQQQQAAAVKENDLSGNTCASSPPNVKAISLEGVQACSILSHHRCLSAVLPRRSTVCATGRLQHHTSQPIPLHRVPQLQSCRTASLLPTSRLQNPPCQHNATYCSPTLTLPPQQHPRT
jgi:hypothetical protein